MREDQFGGFVETLEVTPIKVSNLLSGLGEEQLRFKPDNNTFSLKENLLHLRDLEVEGYRERIRLILAEHVPVLHDVDGKRLASLRHYQLADAAYALRQFIQAREGNLAYIRNMTGFQWRRRALWNEKEITLFHVVAQWAEHDLQHLREMDELSAKLQKPAA
jgi:hypothetical protein